MDLEGEEDNGPRQNLALLAIRVADCCMHHLGGLHVEVQTRCKAMQCAQEQCHMNLVLVLHTVRYNRGEMLVKYTKSSAR